MKLNKIMLAAAMTLGAFGVAHAADAVTTPASQGGGQLSFSGSIIDSPCSISSESINQDIQLGAISQALLKKADGHSTPVSVKIKLESCDFGAADKLTKNNVTVTFNGLAAAGDSKMLALGGNTSDAGIVFTDATGKKIDLGKASDKTVLTEDSSLQFSAYVQASKASGAVIVPGDFTAVANFKMAYQ